MGCGASVATEPINQNGTRPNGNITNTKIPITVTKHSMKGDYSQFQLAKYQREKQQKERQQRLYITADELSGKVLEERERLSLGTRSRATSRNTSRTTSPTSNKRNAQNREEHTVPMTPVIEDRNRSESYRSEDSLNKRSRSSSIGATVPSETQDNKKKTKHKTKKKIQKGEKSKSKKKSNKKSKTKPKKKTIESEESDSGLDDSPHYNESSDGVQSNDAFNEPDEGDAKEAADKLSISQREVFNEDDKGDTKEDTDKLSIIQREDNSVNEGGGKTESSCKDSAGNNEREDEIQTEEIVGQEAKEGIDDNTGDANNNQSLNNKDVSGTDNESEKHGSSQNADNLVSDNPVVNGDGSSASESEQSFKKVRFEGDSNIEGGQH